MDYVFAFTSKSMNHIVSGIHLTLIYYFNFNYTIYYYIILSKSFNKPIYY